MEEKGFFKNFIEDEFSMNYFNSIDCNLRINLTLISFWCNTLVEASDEQCNADFRENVANNIIKACCGILRPNEIVSKIIEANRNYRIKKTVIELNEFFTEFCNNCNVRTGKRCKLKLKKCDKMYINVSEKFLVSVLLMYVRNALLNQAKKIDISCSEELNKVTICLKIKTNKDEDSMFGDMDSDALSDYTYEIASFFAEKMNGETQILEDEISIKFPSAKGNAFHEKKAGMSSTNMFNSYNVLLSEFNDFNYY